MKRRLRDPEEAVAQRRARAADEMSHWQAYDDVFVNSEVPESLARVQAILAAERLKRERQLGLRDFAGSLRQGG